MIGVTDNGHQWTIPLNGEFKMVKMTMNHES